jgi:hypothetical protein
MVASMSLGLVGVSYIRGVSIPCEVSTVLFVSKSE